MEEKYDVLELVSKMFQAKTEQDWEAILKECLKILPMLEKKEEKMEFFQGAILEAVLGYSKALTGKEPQQKKGKVIIPL